MTINQRYEPVAASKRYKAIVAISATTTTKHIGDKIAILCHTNN